MSTKFNHSLTQAQLTTMGRKIRAKELTMTAAAEHIGVHPSTLSRWVHDPKRSMWQSYQEQKEYDTRTRQETWLIETPEGETKTYAECAERLEISVGSFAKRIRKYGAANPRVWIVGRCTKNNTTGKNPRASWEGLSSRSRDHMLAKIPGPTKFERKLYKNW